MAVMDLRIYNDRPLVIGATGVDALLQNIKIIILTTVFSIPLDRDFAHINEVVDSPAPHITARLTGLLVEAIEKYEPRIKVESLTFEEETSDRRGALMEGRLTPRIRFTLRDGVEL